MLRHVLVCVCVYVCVCVCVCVHVPVGLGGYGSLPPLLNHTPFPEWKEAGPTPTCSLLACDCMVCVCVCVRERDREREGGGGGFAGIDLAAQECTCEGVLLRGRIDTAVSFWNSVADSHTTVKEGMGRGGG